MFHYLVVVHGQQLTMVRKRSAAGVLASARLNAQDPGTDNDETAHYHVTVAASGEASRQRFSDEDLGI